MELTSVGIAIAVAVVVAVVVAPVTLGILVLVSVLKKRNKRRQKKREEILESICIGDPYRAAPKMVDVGNGSRDVASLSEEEALQLRELCSTELLRIKSLYKVPDSVAVGDGFRSLTFKTNGLVYLNDKVLDANAVLLKDLLSAMRLLPRLNDKLAKNQFCDLSTEDTEYARSLLKGTNRTSSIREFEE
jgi:hypothetical protein